MGRKAYPPDLVRSVKFQIKFTRQEYNDLFKFTKGQKEYKRSVSDYWRSWLLGAVKREKIMQELRSGKKKSRTVGV